MRSPARGPSPERLGCSDCERIRDGWLAQPVNTATSLAYVVAGAVVAAQDRQSPADRRGGLVSATLLAGVGLGSVAYHGPQPRGARAAHDWPIAGLTALVLATPLVRRWRGQRALPGWTAGRGGVIAALTAASAAAYAGGRSGAPTCAPDSPLQLHGAWHVLSAATLAGVVELLFAAPGEVDA